MPITVAARSEALFVRPYDGTIRCPRNRTDSVQDQETGKVAKAKQRAVQPNNTICG
jgi:type IV secretory pathway VirD2 relaxase